MVTVSKRNRWIAADWFADFFERNRNGMFLCVIATFAWGLVTHAYIFLHSSFSHDSLNEFNAAVFGNAWRIQLGRIFVPAYRLLVREAITLPWLIGVLSLLYISAAVFLTVKLFGIRSRLLTALIAGVYTANITVTATAATYIHDLDCNMLALALAVLAVYLWKRFDKGFLYGMLPLCVSMGLYQSYLSVAITLVILYLVLQLLDGHPFAEVFGKGLKSLGMIVGAGALYYLAIQLVCRITGLLLVSGTYNSMDSILSRPVPEILYTAVTGYIQVGYKLCTAVSAQLVANLDIPGHRRLGLSQRACAGGTYCDGGNQRCGRAVPDRSKRNRSAGKAAGAAFAGAGAAWHECDLYSDRRHEP